jgi:hypothetical protein
MTIHEQAQEAQKRLLRACEAEGSDPRRLGTMSEETRVLWREATRTRLLKETLERRRAGGW